MTSLDSGNLPNRKGPWLSASTESHETNKEAKKNKYTNKQIKTS